MFVKDAREKSQPHSCCCYSKEALNRFITSDLIVYNDGTGISKDAIDGHPTSYKGA